MKYFFAVLTLISLSCNKAGEPNIEIKNAWIRNSYEGMTTALFFDVINTGDGADTLYKVVSGLTDIVQIHETFTEGDKMGMREVENVVIEPKTTFSFKPRAHHIMFINLKNNIEEGEQEEVTLFFKRSGEVKISVPVKKMIMN